MVDMVLESDGGEELSFLQRIQIDVHLLFCARCAEELRRYKLGRELLSQTALFTAPDLCGPLMDRILEEEAACAYEEEEAMPLRRWIISGCIIVASLVSAFFGFEFLDLSSADVSSLVIPMSITIGLFISAYSALFIGSHLKELSERFRLR
jgi:hypothetical protein